MIEFQDMVKLRLEDVKNALQYGSDNPEPGHSNPMTGILRSAGKWILGNVFDCKSAEALILRLQTTQVLGRMLYVPIGFVKDGRQRIVAIYVHMPKSRLATCDSVKGITVAGWVESGTLRTLHVPGTDIICTGNRNVLEPMSTINYRRIK